jgi:hypothetical protein
MEDEDNIEHSINEEIRMMVGVGDDEEDLLPGQEELFGRSALAQTWKICVSIYFVYFFLC